MSINPINRLYDDIVNILNTMEIKYSSKADEFETLETKSYGDRYLCALNKTDTFGMYADFTVDELKSAGITDPTMIKECLENRFKIPIVYRNTLLSIRRERELKEYEEQNNYYRMLNGLPDIEDKDIIYPDPEICKKYKMPENVPVHRLESDLGRHYASIIEDSGELDRLMKLYPEKKYLKYICSKKIPIHKSRQAGNFALLYMDQSLLMESTAREFISLYEKARLYFISCIYVYEFKDVIPYYENFIALCIFIMAIQQVSMRSIENATKREFYDEYMVQMLYESYGFPYYNRVDTNTQKLIVQNLNKLIQNKATNKVLIDIASILGFDDIKIYQYYLVKERIFDKKGYPEIHKTTRVNPSTGESEEVYDYKKMYNLYFQRVPIDTQNIKQDLMDTNNRADYNDIVYYDPYWWEDDELTEEIWEKEYNYVETKYMGLTTPYRMTDILFQSVLLLNIILDKEEYNSIEISLPKITKNKVSFKEAIILFLALMAKKLGISGQILSTPSKIAHVLETLDQDINKENKKTEIFKFNFNAFSPENVEETKEILAPYFKRKTLSVETIQDSEMSKNIITEEIDETDLDTFCNYIVNLWKVGGVSNEEKAKSLNALYSNIKALYEFLNYQMSKTTDIDEYYALKKFYDTAFYTNEVSKIFNIETDEGNRSAKTFVEYFKYTNMELATFIENVEKDSVYSYIDHIIYKMDQLIQELGNLYLLNDGFSPLIELLEIMIKFFKSYRLDFVQSSSLLIVDYEIENTFRLFGYPHYIKKVNAIAERFDTDFMDLVERYTATFSVEDAFALFDYIRAQCKIHIEDENLFYDMEKYIHMKKICAIEEKIKSYDAIAHEKAAIRESSDMFFYDECVKKID